MAIRRFKKGTGITAFDWETADGEDLRPAMDQFFSDWNAARKSGGDSDYGAISLSAMTTMKTTLQRAGPGPHPDDSEADFAKRVLKSHEFAFAALERTAAAHGKDSEEFRNADTAARFAWRAGIVYAMAAMKFHHEFDAIRGERVLQGAKDSLTEAHRKEIARRKQCANLIWDELKDKNCRQKDKIETALQLLKAKGFSISVSQLRRDLGLKK